MIGETRCRHARSSPGRRTVGVSRLVAATYQPADADRSPPVVGSPRSPRLDGQRTRRRPSSVAGLVSFARCAFGNAALSQSAGHPSLACLPGGLAQRPRGAAVGRPRRTTRPRLFRRRTLSGDVSASPRARRRDRLRATFAVRRMSRRSGGRHVLAAGGGGPIQHAAASGSADARLFPAISAWPSPALFGPLAAIAAG